LYVYTVLSSITLTNEAKLVEKLLGAKIKQLRKAKGLTLEQLAQAIGSGKSYIWEIENRGVKRPSAEKLAAIARILDTTSEYLINNEMNQPTEDQKRTVFFRKFERLDEGDQQKIEDIIDAWSKK
jgi:transcriptional regulator with XRE-family HTH domain